MHINLQFTLIELFSDEVVLCRYDPFLSGLEKSRYPCKFKLHMDCIKTGA